MGNAPRADEPELHDEAGSVVAYQLLVAGERILLQKDNLGVLPQLDFKSDKRLRSRL